jgi:hypothetical protein
MMETLPSSETSVLTRAARRNIPEYAILHSHRREKLKSYIPECSSALHRGNQNLLGEEGGWAGVDSQTLWRFRKPTLFFRLIGCEINIYIGTHAAWMSEGSRPRRATHLAIVLMPFLVSLKVNVRSCALTWTPYGFYSRLHPRVPKVRRRMQNQYLGAREIWRGNFFP